MIDSKIKEKIVFGIQCSVCLRVLGVSETEQAQHIFCYTCAKARFNTELMK